MVSLRSYECFSNDKNAICLIKILFLLRAWSCFAVDAKQIDCREIEKPHNITCEGRNMTLQCPQEKPLMKIEEARFGREYSEKIACPRPGSKGTGDERGSKHIPCITYETKKVATICRNRSPCVFKVNNATFDDPCGPEVYKYMLVLFTCECRRRRSTRNEPKPSSCIARARPTSSTATSTDAIHPTPTLTLFGSSISQSNMRKSTHPPVTATPTRSKGFQTRKKSMSMEHRTFTHLKKKKEVGSQGNSTVQARNGHGRGTLFFAVAELFSIYNEAAREKPSIALMWCFVGMLLGLFIVTMSFLYVGTRRKREKKKLFQLSQLKPEDGEIQSPTIRADEELRESPERDTTEMDAKVPAVFDRNGHAGKHLSSVDSWCELTSLYINPLYRGLRQNWPRNNEIKVEARNHEQERLISRSEPCNLSAKTENEYVEADHNDGGHQGDQNETVTGCHNSDNETVASSHSNHDEMRNGNHSNDNSQRNSANHTAGSSDNVISGSFKGRGEQPDVVSNYLNNNWIKKRRNVYEERPSSTPITVGIPSYPIPDPKVFHPEAIREKKSDSEKVGDEQDKCKSDVSQMSSVPLVTEKLLTKFGIESDERRNVGNNINTTISAPCLYIKEDSEEHKSPDLQGTTSRLKVHSRCFKGESFNSSFHTTKAAPSSGDLSPPKESNTRTVQQPVTSNIPTITPHENQPPPFEKGRKRSTYLSKMPSMDRENKQTYTTCCKTNSNDRRPSSGYYSNGTSPMVEQLIDSGASNQQEAKQQSIEQQKPSSGDDDLPPLPPPAPPLIPIMPLSYIPGDYLNQKNTDEKNSNRISPKMPSRKVHFKSPSQS